MVKDSPAQIDPEFTEIIGKAFTVTVDTASIEDTHPLASVPLTEYVALAVGVATELPFE
jgi:hypothetical protein